MMIIFECSTCKTLIRVDGKFSGRRGTCKQCNSASLVPGASEPRLVSQQLAREFWKSPVSSADRATGVGACDYCNGDIPVGRGFLTPPIAADDAYPSLACERCFEKVPRPWDGDVSRMPPDHALAFAPISQSARELQQAPAAQASVAGGGAAPGAQARADARTAWKRVDVREEVSDYCFDDARGVLVEIGKLGLPTGNAWKLGSWSKTSAGVVPNQEAICENGLVSIDDSSLEIRTVIVSDPDGKRSLYYISAAPQGRPFDVNFNASRTWAHLLWDPAQQDWVAGILARGAGDGDIHFDVSDTGIAFRCQSTLGLFQLAPGRPVDLTKPRFELDYSISSLPRGGLANEIMANVLQRPDSVAFTRDGTRVYVGRNPKCLKDKLYAPGEWAAYDMRKGKRIEQKAYSDCYGKQGGKPRYWYVSLLTPNHDELHGMVSTTLSGTFAVGLQDLRSGAPLCEPLTPDSPLTEDYPTMVAQCGIVAWIRAPNTLEVWRLPNAEPLLSTELDAPARQIKIDARGRFLCVIRREKSTGLFSSPRILGFDLFALGNSS